MVCRVELERSICSLGSLTLQVTQKIQENRKNPLKMWYTNRQYRKKRNMEGFFMAEAKFKRPELTDRDLIDFISKVPKQKLRPYFCKCISVGKVLRSRNLHNITTFSCSGTTVQVTAMHFRQVKMKM